MKRSSRVLLLVAVTSVSLLTSLASAQLPGVPAVQSGMRMTFYSSSASVRGSRQQAVLKPNCDPSKEQCWTDSSGRTIGLDDVPTASGQGYTIIDVLYLDAQTCLMRYTSYTLDPTDGRIATAAVGAELSTGGTCSDFYVNPTTLQQMQPQSTSTLRVMRGPYTLGNITVDAVMIAQGTGSGYMNSSYDSATGLLVVASSRSQGADIPTITNSTLHAGAGNTMLTYTQLLNARAMAGIGIVEQLPAYVLDTNRLLYDCSMITSVPGAGAMETPCRLEVRVGQRNPLWALTSAVQSTPNPITGIADTAESTNVLAATGHGGYFASPALLARLQQGSVLDQDPVTGVRTSVGGVDARSVTIFEEGNGERRAFVYDPSSGWLLQYVVEQYLPTGSFATRYTLVGVD